MLSCCSLFGLLKFIELGTTYFFVYHFGDLNLKRIGKLLGSCRLCSQILQSEYYWIKTSSSNFELKANRLIGQVLKSNFGQTERNHAHLHSTTMSERKDSKSGNEVLPTPFHCTLPNQIQSEPSKTWIIRRSSARRRQSIKIEPPTPQTKMFVYEVCGTS